MSDEERRALRVTEARIELYAWLADLEKLRVHVQTEDSAVFDQAWELALAKAKAATKRYLEAVKSL